MRQYLVALADRHHKPVWQIERDYTDADLLEFMALDKLRNDKPYRERLEYSLCVTPAEQAAWLQRKLNLRK